MKKDKKSFTLSEVLISMAIIGFVMAMSLSTIKIVKTSYTALTYFTFKNIKDMVGEAFAGSLPQESALSDTGERMSYPIARCTYKKDATDVGVTVNVLVSDYEDGETEQRGVPLCQNRKNYQGEAKNLFCKSLVGMLNVTGTVDCDNLYDVGNDGSEPYIKGSGPGSVDIKESGLKKLKKNQAKPNFVTTNGQRYFLSKWVYDTNVSDIYGFRLLAVDLNGISNPNIIDAADPPKHAPDRVTFLIMDNGEVYPLGVAATNLTIGNKKIQYLTARIKGYYYSHNPQRTNNVPEECARKDQEGNLIKTCNYAVVYFEHQDEKDKTNEIFNYKEAYCNSIGPNTRPAYKTYCTGIARTTLCPPSNDPNKFDSCKVETVKPLFRYNFK